jgi:hypothetical protein
MNLDYSFIFSSLMKYSNSRIGTFALTAGKKKGRQNLPLLVSVVCGKLLPLTMKEVG